MKKEAESGVTKSQSQRIPGPSGPGIDKEGFSFRAFVTALVTHWF